MPDRLIPLFFTFLLVIVAGASMYLQTGDSEPVAPWTLATAENPTGSYRYTSEGWQDSTQWQIQLAKSAQTQSLAKRIHPLYVAALVLLLALGSATLVSNEKEVSRVWSRSDPAS